MILPAALNRGKIQPKSFAYSLPGLRSAAFALITILFISFTAQAQDSATRQHLANLGSRLDTISKRQQSLADSVADLKDSVLAKAISESFSRSLDEAKMHPGKLYQHGFKDHMIISVIAFILLLLFLWFSFSFFANTALCRDASYDKSCTLKPVESRPYSYSRVQLFWWTLIILFCYILFFALYGVLLPLNPTVILLLGSGVAVYIFGKSMDKDQIRKNNAEEPARHQDLHDSKGFLTDILSDENGISIHRLQAVAFNIVYGLGFLSAFFSALSDASNKKYTYPLIEFEPWQLSLLGISAIGYLGLKSSENHPDTRGERRNTAMREERASASARRESLPPQEEPAVKRTDITG
ncbi:MAG TPA: hypothetical protein VGB56_05950 [Flavisolibacter sp.]|jgi:hypothetical protein